MKRYKLTDGNMKTGHGHRLTDWEIGEPQEVSGSGDLCGSGWIHVYTHPLLAVLLNSIHANFNCPRLFECECEGAHKEDHGIKEGWQKVTLTKELALPQITTEQRITIAILSVKKVYKDEKWNTWADDWLSGKDRSGDAAAAAYTAANAAANAAAYTAANAAAYTAAYTANAAAYAAARAATYAATDLIAIVNQVCGIYKESF